LTKFDFIGALVFRKLVLSLFSCCDLCHRLAWYKWPWTIIPQRQFSFLEIINQVSKTQNN